MSVIVSTRPSGVTADDLLMALDGNAGASAGGLPVVVDLDGVHTALVVQVLIDGDGVVVLRLDSGAK